MPIGPVTWERNVIKERTFSGKLRRAQEGKNPGMKPPYGYELKDDGSFGIVPGEAAIVQRIYQLYLSGMGGRRILQTLNQEGYRPRTGNAWSQSTVARILSNPAYVGRLEYGRRRTQRDGKRVTKEALVVTENSSIPALISQEDWDAVQALKASRPGFGRGKGSGRTTVSEALLTGLLKCRCGHGFAARKTDGKYRYYRCLGVHMKGSAFCDCASVRQELVDDLVVSSLRSLFGGKEPKERMVKRVVARWEKQLHEATANIRVLEKELQKLEVGEQRLKKLLRDGELTVPEYRELREDLERDSTEFRESWDKARRLKKQAMSGVQAQARLAETLNKVDEWERLDHVSRKQLLGQFIEEIQLYRRLKSQEVDCHIVWRWDSTILGDPQAPADTSHVVEQASERPAREYQRNELGRFVSEEHTERPRQHQD